MPVFPPPLEIIDLHTKCPAWKKCTLSIILNLILHDFFWVVCYEILERYLYYCNYRRSSIVRIQRYQFFSCSHGDFSGKIPIIDFFSSRILVIKEFFPNVIPSIARNPIIEDPPVLQYKTLGWCLSDNERASFFE